MQIIWYNSNSNKYEHGKEAIFNSESKNSQDPYTYTKLMELDTNSASIASKVIRQLNIAAELPLLYVAQ